MAGLFSEIVIGIIAFLVFLSILAVLKFKKVAIGSLLFNESHAAKLWTISLLIGFLLFVLLFLHFAVEK
jgi:hypothetical protein